MAVGFKAQRGLRMPYRRQGLIYFTMVNYDGLPEKQKKHLRFLKELYRLKRRHFAVVRH